MVLFVVVGGTISVGVFGVATTGAGDAISTGGAQAHARRESSCCATARHAAACATLVRTIAASGLSRWSAMMTKQAVVNAPQAKRSRAPRRTVAANQTKTSASQPMKAVV